MSRESKTPKQFGPGVVKAKLVICIIMERMIHTLDIENIYNQIATLADEHAPLNVLVDLSGVQKVSSSFLGKLITLYRRLEEQGGRKFAVSSANPKIINVIKVLKLHKSIPIYEDAAKAIADM